MIHRLRMARKRLGIARERANYVGRSLTDDRFKEGADDLRKTTLRAIERRKERIA